MEKYLKYQEEALSSLFKLLSINSINDPKTVTEKEPFGKGVAESLEFVAKLGESMGFDVDRCDGYCTELSFGKGKLIDVYAHCDVVPVGDNWDSDPFTPVIKDNKIVARGAIDDKGPLIASLYGLKKLKDENLINGYKVRFVAGGNEELGSRCLEYYFHRLKKEFPYMGFTPDGSFPLIYGEKSIGLMKISYKTDLHVENFQFGDALNIVIDKATIKVNNNLEALKTIKREFADFNIEHKDGELIVEGRAAHGSLPWLGLNASIPCISYLALLNHDEVLIKYLKAFEDGKGAEFGCNFKSKYFDGTSFNLGRVIYKDNLLTFFFNVRIPESCTPNDILNKASSYFDQALVEVSDFSEMLLVDPEEDLVTTLLNVYQDITGDKDSKPLAIGGGTYAKESKNTIAFGPTFGNFDYHEHDKNEFIPVDEFYKLIEIYYEAIKRLGEKAR